MRKKNFFTLLEVVVLVSLFSIFVVVILRFFSHYTLVDNYLEKHRNSLNAIKYTHQELLSIFSSLLPSSLISDKEHPIPLFTMKTKNMKHAELFFFFDHGIDPESKFSGPTYGKIGIDDQKNLLLTLWPYPLEKKCSARSKILCKNIDSMTFEFLEASIGSNPKNYWPKNSKNLPYLLKITLKHPDKPISFAFFIGSEKNFLNFS